MRKEIEQKANLGDTDAQLHLAQAYDPNRPEALQVGKDAPTAIIWYRKASAAGNAEAQFRLGMLLGSLDDSDMNEARHFLRSAAEQGHKKAKEVLDGLEIATRPAVLDEFAKRNPDLIAKEIANMLLRKHS